ncbi:putative RNA-directed DNA polymerase from transposon BS [Trichonephila clavipes]|nr:putative RNA-directed DNA polymerase from transposon BS [Trichonephila clavipes]
MTVTLPPLSDSVVGGGTPERRFLRLHMDPMLLCPGKGLVLPKKPNVGQIATNVRFFLIPLQYVEISKKSPFAIHKALIGIGGEPKSVKRLRSGDLLIETLSTLQTKSFLLSNTFLDSSVTISPHNSLNTSRGVISELDLFSTSESEIHLKDFLIRVCASVEHTSTDCSLEPKCINCSQPHTADSKLCPKWKNEKQIQEIKTNENLTYVEAPKLIVPQLVQTYAEAAKPSIVNNSTQTDENITQIKCPPLNLLQPLSSLPKPNVLISTPAISTSSSSTQAELLPPISAKAATVLQPEPPIPMSNVVLSNMFTPIESSSIVSTSLFNDIQPLLHRILNGIPS